MARDEPGPDPPSFGEVRDALTPPGTGKGALWDALKAAQRTGGHIPGAVAPDVSAEPPAGLLEALRAATRTMPCPQCRTFHPQGTDCPAGFPQAGYGSLPDQSLAVHAKQLMATGHLTAQDAARLAREIPEPSFPEDPFTPGKLAAAATADWFRDLCEAGIPVSSVESILGHMLAAFATGKEG
jgi:hypothetical protein